MAACKLVSSRSRLLFYAKTHIYLEADVINKDKDNQPGNRKAASLVLTSSIKSSNKYLLCALRTILRLKC